MLLLIFFILNITVIRLNCIVIVKLFRLWIWKVPSTTPILERPRERFSKWSNSEKAAEFSNAANRSSLFIQIIRDKNPETTFWNYRIRNQDPNEKSRYQIYSRSMDKKVKIHCSSCSIMCCSKHLKTVCETCSTNI